MVDCVQGSKVIVGDESGYIEPDIIWYVHGLDETLVPDAGS